MTDVVTGSLQVDLKRRTTLPGDILVAAGIRPGSSLVARVAEPGRIVLESPALLLALLQDDIAAALARPTDNADRDGDAPHHATNDVHADPSEGQAGNHHDDGDEPVRDLVAELLADRVGDASLSPEQTAGVNEPSATVEPHREGGHHDAGSAEDFPAPRDGAA